MAVTGRLVALLVVGIVPVILLSAVPGGPALAVLGWLVLCALLVVIDLLGAASPRQLGVERVLPDRVRLDEDVEQTILVTNLGRRLLRGVLRDPWVPSVRRSSALLGATVPPGERRALRSVLRAGRRGDQHSPGIAVRSLGPLGLAARQAMLDVPGRIRVLPPFRSRRHLPSRLLRLRELDGATSILTRGQGTEFDSLREYVRGDDVRSIDWRATARGREVVVRTWRPERDRRIVIIADTARTQATRVGDETRLDTAFESALLLSALADRAGDRVDFVALDRRVRTRVHGRTGPALIPELVDAMSTIEPELIEMDWSLVPGVVRRATTQRSLVVLLTALDSRGQASPLLAALPEITQRHLVLVAAVEEPELRRLSAERGDRAEVYRAAAAERALAERGRLIEAVRRQGGDVVVAPPGTLPTALVDRYLHYKATGRL